MVLFSCLAAPVRTAVPPHIVLVVADDLGWGDVGWNNPDMADVTQELSRLAGERSSSLPATNRQLPIHTGLPARHLPSSQPNSLSGYRHVHWTGLGVDGKV